MAEGINVGKLVITISGDTKDVEAAAARVGKSLKGMDKDVQGTARNAVTSFRDMARSILPAATAAGVLVTAFRAFHAAIADVTALDRLSQATGTSMRGLQSLRTVVEQTGGDFNALSQTLATHAQRLQEAVLNPATPAAQALRALGISATDAAGNMRTLDDMLPDLAERFSRYADGANKSALASRLFGEAGGPEMVRLLNLGRDELARLRREHESTSKAIDVEKVRELQRANALLTDATRQLATEFALMAAGPARAVLDNLTALIRYLNQASGASMPRAAQAMVELQARLGELALIEGEMARSNRLTRWLTDATGRAPELQRQIQALREELAGFVRADEEAYARRQQRRQQAPGQDPDAIARQQFALEQWLAAASGQRTMLQDLDAAWQTHAQIVDGAVSRIRAVQQTAAQQEMAIARVRQQLLVQYDQQLVGVARSVGSAIAQMWPKQKGAAIAAAIINTAAGVTEAMKLPFPLNWAQAAAVAAMGAAQIGTIRSTNSDGASGGAPSASAGAAATAPAAAPQQMSLHIQGLDPAAIFSGAQVEELLRVINNATMNGHVLISTRNIPA
jgi:hypothetical protein